MAIADIGDTEIPRFAFSDFELSDANLTALARGNAPDFSQASRDNRARILRFTLTVLHPRLINPGVLDIDPLKFPSQQATPVYVRALLFNGNLTGVVTKAMLDETPKNLLAFYAQAEAEFDICIKTRKDATPNPEKYEQWIREITAKTKFYACKQYIQKSHVGRLEGTATLAQRLVNIKQRYYDKVTQQANYRSVQELSQEYQRLLAEIKPSTMPTEIPQLDNIFVQSVSEDLRKKLIRHLGQEPATTIDENIQHFNDLVLSAMDAEEELRTVTNIAERAAFHQTRPYGP
jgi:hypothetical protein